MNTNLYIYFSIMLVDQVKWSEIPFRVFKALLKFVLLLLLFFILRTFYVINLYIFQFLVAINLAIYCQIITKIICFQHTIAFFIYYMWRKDCSRTQYVSQGRNLIAYTVKIGKLNNYQYTFVSCWRVFHIFCLQLTWSVLCILFCFMCDKLVLTK